MLQQHDNLVIEEGKVVGLCLRAYMLFKKMIVYKNKLNNVQVVANQLFH